MPDPALLHDIGQLLWVGFEGATAPPDLLAQLDAGAWGATIVFKRNLVVAGERTDLDRLVALTEQLHRTAPDGTPALIAIDQEGGRVQRVRAPATVWPAMYTHDALPSTTDATAVAEAVGLAMGRELRALGIDIDFAPVLDVHTNPTNTVIGDRAFASDPERVATRGLAFARGLAAAGVLACGKHFPGHGDTSTDSHYELPRIDHDWERLERVELLPFARAAAADLPMIMTAHVIFAALDATRPATLSPAVITGLLRDKLNFRGVIVSDDLDMQAITAHFPGGVAAAAPAAIRAGCDALLLCESPAHQAAAAAALAREADDDAALRARIAASAARIRAMKRALATSQRAIPAPPLAVVGSHGAISDRLRSAP